MRILGVNDEAAVEAAAQALAAGRLVVIPTETVYGLAADATDARAVLGIFEAKRRPRFNPLISHCADLAMARRHGRFDARALRLAEAFWPGPLTLVVPKTAACGIAPLVTAGLDTLALRVPAQPAVRAVIARLDRPLAAPSANRSGRVSPTTVGAAADEVGDAVALLLDAGPCTVGVESTIVACTAAGAVLLRPGGVPREEIEAVLGEALATPAGGDARRPQAPGMLDSHYAPQARVRLAAAAPEPGEAYLGFGGLPPGAAPALSRDLSARGDLREAAVNLFAHLRALDATGAPSIAVAPIPATGFGEAINDRLRRAAAPRPG